MHSTTKGNIQFLDRTRPQSISNSKYISINFYNREILWNFFSWIIILIRKFNTAYFQNILRILFYQKRYDKQNYKPKAFSSSNI